MSRNRMASPCLVTLISLGLTVAVSTSQQVVKRQSEVAGAKAALAKAEEALKRALDNYKQGATSIDQLEEARLGLVQAHLLLAVLEQQGKVILADLERLVVIRERVWETAKKRSQEGALPPIRVTQAAVYLSEARLYLEAFRNVSLRTQELAFYEEAAKAGAFSLIQLNEARKALENSKRRLKREQARLFPETK